MEKADVRVFSSEKSILWGESVTEATSNAIKASTHGIIFVSRGSTRAGDRKNTVGSALILKASEDENFLLLPTYVEGEISAVEMKKSSPLLANFKSLTIGSCLSRQQSLDMVMAELSRKLYRLFFAFFDTLFVVGFIPSLKKSTGPFTSASVGSLPGEPACLVGRDVELRSVLASVSSEFHLCCISGPPAAGKSAIAITAAHHVLKRSPPWEVIYVDISHSSNKEEIIQHLQDSLDLRYGHLHSVNARTPEKSLLMRVQKINNLCIVIDNADMALKSNNGRPFIELLTSITKAGKRELTLIVTSCYRLGRRLKGRGRVQEVDVKPLTVEPACKVLKFFFCDRFSDSEAEMLAQDVCQGLPGFLLQIPLGAGQSTKERFDTLLERPFDCFEKSCCDAAICHFEKLFKSLSDDKLAYLPSLALFDGSFSKADGAYVVGMKDDKQKFGTEVIDYLDNYSLIVQDADRRDHFYLLRIFREFLREKKLPNEKFLSDATERYCKRWLKKLFPILEKEYDHDPCKALKTLHGMIKDIRRVLSLVELASAHDEVYKLYIRLALDHKSMLRVCFTPTERRAFFSSCIFAAAKRRNELDKGKLSLRFAESCLDGNDLEGADTGTPAWPGGEQALRGSNRRWYFQSEIMKARLQVEKNESQAAIKRLLNLLELGGDSTPLKETREYVDVFRVLADAYVSIGEYELAVARLSEALAFCNVRFGRKCGGSYPDTCSLLSRLGHCFFCQERYDDALSHHVSALKMASALQCDHLSFATFWYLVGISRLGASVRVGRLSATARNELEEVIYLLEDEPSCETIPLQIFATVTVAKHLVYEGRELLKEGRRDEGLATLEKADKFFSLAEESEELLPSEAAEENRRFRVYVHAVRNRADLIVSSDDIDVLTLYSSQGVCGWTSDSTNPYKSVDSHCTGSPMNSLPLSLGTPRVNYDTSLTNSLLRRQFS